MLPLPPAQALPPPIHDSSMDAFRLSLLALLKDDQVLREKAEKVIQAKGLQSDEAQALLTEQENLDQRNRERLQKLLAQHGWPRISQVGEEAALTAFLVIQHADLAAQKRWFPALQAAAALGEARRSWAALMEDRILMGEGLPQNYGTQVAVNAEGKVSLHPIKNPEQVDERRKAVGLEPLAEYLKGFGLTWVPPGPSAKPVQAPSRP